MRTFILFFTLALITLPINSQTIEGTYSNRWEAPTGEALEYSLTLQEDGSFVFYTTRVYRSELPDKKISATGTWNLNGHLLQLNTSNDVESQNSLQSKLDTSKARFITISPRNPNFNLVKPSLKFYESEVFYAKDMELIKTENTVSSLN